MIQQFKRILKKTIENTGLKVARKKYWMNYATLIKKHNISSIIDVGANVGQFAIEILQTNKNITIYSFEPIKSVFELLKDNLKDYKNALVFNCGLGNKIEKTKMFLNESTPSSSLLEMEQAHTELFPNTSNFEQIVVEIDTLDTFDFKNILEKNILLKIDVQGFEDKVLEGANEFLKKCEVVIMEINYKFLYKGQKPFYHFFELMSNHGFIFVGNLEDYFSEEDEIICSDAVFIRKK